MTRTGPAVVKVEGVMSGAACFRGTRVPSWMLFAYLADCRTIDEFTKDYQTVTYQQAVSAVTEAGRLLSAAAPTVPYRPQGRRHDRRSGRA